MSIIFFRILNIPLSNLVQNVEEFGIQTRFPAIETAFNVRAKTLKRKLIPHTSPFVVTDFIKEVENMATKRRKIAIPVLYAGCGVELAVSSSGISLLKFTVILTIQSSS